MSKSVEIGDLVSVNYVGRFESGEVFDSSEGGAPLQFTVGQGEVIKGFEKAVIDMKAGEIKTVTIPPEDGYGEYVQNRYIDMPKTNIPKEFEVEVGMQMQLVSPDGKPVQAIVQEIFADRVRMDINHPMAGKTLVFDMSLVKIGS